MNIPVILPEQIRQQPLDLVSLSAQTGWVLPAAESQGQNAIMGETVLPPMNAMGLIRVPLRPPEQTQARLSRLGLRSLSDLPEDFSWRSLADIKKYKGWTLTESPLTPVPNQYTCGSCWAWSSATMLSDRWSIFTGHPNPLLSPSYLMACMPESEKCNGGYPSAAGKFFETQGTVSLSCWNYSWCSDNKDCTHGGMGVDVSTLVPPCQEQCLHSSSTFFKIRAKPGSTQALVRIRDIQVDLLQHGPVVAVFRVFGDFIAGSMKQGNHWAKTKGVYVKIPGKDLYQYGTLNCQGVRVSSVDCYLGNHAVVIVGWGVARKVPNFLHTGGPPLDLPYWIIRNSWGSEWNGDGYFHMAMTDLTNGINTLCGLDLPLHLRDNQLFGGVTTWEPLTDFVRPSKLLTWSPHISGTPLSSVILFTSLFILFLAVVYVVSKKWHARTK